MRLGLVAASLIAATSAQAADFKVDSFAAGTPIISMSGMIEDGDDVKFMWFADALSVAYFRLTSPGGRIMPAMKIGEMARAKGYTTYVPAGAECSSACGLIWIAGKIRQTATTGRVGFHASYQVVDGKPLERGQGNAIIGAYLTKLGFGYEAVSFATSAAPTEMAWLSPQIATQISVPYSAEVDEITTLATAASGVPIQSAAASPAVIMQPEYTRQPLYTSAPPVQPAALPLTLIQPPAPLILAIPPRRPHYVGNARYPNQTLQGELADRMAGIASTYNPTILH